MRLAKFRRFTTLLHARAPRNFATAAQLTAPQLRSLWPLTHSPSMSADRFATSSTGRCCRRTRSPRARVKFSRSVTVSGLAGWCERWAGSRNGIARGPKALAARPWRRRRRTTPRSATSQARVSSHHGWRATWLSSMENERSRCGAMLIFFNNRYTGASLVGLPIASTIATTTAPVEVVWDSLTSMWVRRPAQWSEQAKAEGITLRNEDGDWCTMDRFSREEISAYARWHAGRFL